MAKRRAKSMVAVLDGSNDMDKLKDLSTLKFEHQAKWFLNAFWTKLFKENPEEREAVYKYCQAMIKLKPNEKHWTFEGRDGCDLEEWSAHVFLEKNTEAQTVSKMRDVLKDLDLDFNKRVSLTEFLISHYKVKYGPLVNAVQNVNDSLQKKLDELKAKVDAFQDKAEEARAASAEADEAHQKQVEAHEETVKILNEIKAFENKLKKAAEKLQAIIDDESVSQVKRMKAKHELNDLKSGARAKRKGLKDKDPDWLRVAKIKQKAAIRREKAATKVAAEAAGLAATAKYEAEQALDQVQEAFDNLKNNSSGGGQGTIWWMGRQLEDMKKYMSSKAFARAQRKLNKKVKNMTASEE